MINLNLDNLFDEKEVLEAVNKIESGGKFWRPKKEKTVLRVLPPIKANGEKLFYFTHRVHWINRVPYECINQTLVDKDGKEHLAEPCPICTLAKKLYKLGETDEEALKEAKAISAKSKDVVRVLVRGDSGAEDKLHFYELPISVKNLFIHAISSGDFGSPPIHPIDGNDLSLQKTGAGQQTKYDSSYLFPKKTALANSKERVVEILQEAQKMTFNSILSFMSEGELKRVLREYAGSVSEQDVQPEKVAPQTVQEKTVSAPTTFVEPTIEKISSRDEDLDNLLSELSGLGEDD
jgi:hypothetical protein